MLETEHGDVQLPEVKHDSYKGATLAGVPLYLSRLDMQELHRRSVFWNSDQFLEHIAPFIVDAAQKYVRKRPDQKANVKVACGISS